MDHSVEPDRIREMIRREEETLARVVDFIRDGQRNGRISDESAEALIALATHEHRGTVRLLRELLDEDESSC
jgi:hypothetical protein